MLPIEMTIAYQTTAPPNTVAAKRLVLASMYVIHTHTYALHTHSFLGGPNPMNGINGL